MYWYTADPLEGIPKRGFVDSHHELHLANQGAITAGGLGLKAPQKPWGIWCKIL